METDLQAAVMKAINLILGNRDRMIKVLQENIETVLSQEDESMMAGIDARLEELQKELLKRANGKVELDDIADEIRRLRELKQNVLEMTEFLTEQTGIVDKCDEQLVRRLVEKVTVFEDRFVEGFRCGPKI